MTRFGGRPGRCHHCGGELPPGSRANRKWCSDKCINAARTKRRYPLTPCACGCGQMSRHTFVKNHNWKQPDFTINDVTGCWDWIKHRNPQGYGQTRRHGETAAHRAYFVEFVGPIPEGMQIDHLCRNPSCVNPDHLEAVTPAENVRRSRVATLSMDDVRAIRGSDLSHNELALKYGITAEHVSAVRRERVWRAA